MINLVESAVSFLFAWIVIAVSLSWFVALIYGWIRSWLLKFPAGTRSTLTLFIVLSPPLIASIVLFLFSHPELNNFLVASHCHGTNCDPHWLHMPVSTVGGMGIVIFAVVVLLLVIGINLRKFVLNSRYLKMLDSFADDSEEDKFRLVETRQPMAWCVGIIHPKVYVSKGLLDQLDAKQIKTVLDHEFSHALHYDNLRKLLIHWCTLVWPQARRDKVRADAVFDIESRCDLEAALKTNGRDFIDTVSVIREFCKSENHQLALPVVTRADGLRRELASYAQSAQELWLRRAQIGFTLMALWIGVTVLSARFGHHLLEWLSR